jgi:hypothetical protein
VVIEFGAWLVGGCAGGSAARGGALRGTRGLLAGHVLEAIPKGDAMRKIVRFYLTFALVLHAPHVNAQERPHLPIDNGPPANPLPPYVAPLVTARPLQAFPANDPRSLPLADLSTVKALGSFSFDWPDGAGGDLSFGGGALGVSEDGKILYWSCVQDDRGIAKLEIPALGARAKVVQPCSQTLRRADLAKVHPDPDAFRPMLGGVHEKSGRVTATSYISYDASNGTTSSHWGGSALATVTGPFAGTVSPGLVGGPMAPIPTEWQPLLGGPALTSLYLRSIVSRSSYGFTASVFDPADVGVKSPIPMTMVVGCRHTDPGCNTYQNDAAGKDNYQGAELSAGFFIIPGTRTLAAIEREASGPSCYGYTTRDPKMHGLDHPGPDDARWCYSLSDNLVDKGPKGYPYRLVAKLYDLTDLVAVKEGGKQPWEIRQYATVDMPGSSASEFVQSGAFNPVTGEYYLVRSTGGGVNTVFVYGGFAKGGAPPPPVDCDGTWSAWARVAGSETACVNSTRNYIEERAFTVTTPASGGGLACPVSPEQRVLPEACQSPSPTVTLTATPASIERGQSTQICWSSTNANTMVLTPGGDNLTPVDGGCVAKSPTADTTYTATAVGDGGQATHSASVQVTDPPPPPPPSRFIGRVRSQAEYRAHGVVAGVRVTLQVGTSMVSTVPARGAAVVVPLPLVDGSVDRRACTVYRVTHDYGYVGAPGDAQVILDCPGMSAVAIPVEVPSSQGGAR